MKTAMRMARAGAMAAAGAAAGGGEPEPEPEPLALHSFTSFDPVVDGSPTLVTPDGVEEGDVLLTAIAIRSSSEIVNTHPDWTLVESAESGSSCQIFLFQREATSSDPASYEWTLSSDTIGVMAGWILCVKGADPTIANISVSASSSTSSLLSLPVVATTQDESLRLAFVAGNPSTTSGLDSPAVTFDEMDLQDEVVGSASPAYGMSGFATAVQPVAGEVASSLARYTTSANARCAIHLAFSPAPVEPEPEPTDPLEGVSIGDPFMGGFYAGIIDTTQGNIIAEDFYQTGARYALIVSPQSLEAENLTWRSNNDDTAESKTRWNGLMVQRAALALPDASEFSASGFGYCDGLAYDDTDGASEWYLPAMDELELVYRYFKPTMDSNNVDDRSVDFPPTTQAFGENPSSTPTGAAYTAGDPAQTSVADFQSGGAEALIAGLYWSATTASGAYGWSQDMQDGLQQPGYTLSSSRDVRPVRRLLL